MARRSQGEVISLEAARNPAPAPAPATFAPTQLSLRDFVAIVLKRRWVVVVFLAIVTAGSAIYALKQPRVYRATCSIEVSPTAPRYLGNNVQDVSETGSGYYWQSKEFFETQYQIIRSRTVVQRVVEKLGLATDVDFLGLSAIKDPAKQREALIGVDAIGKTINMIQVQPVKDSRIVNLAIEDTNPDRAMRISNALADAYLEQNVERRQDTTKAASLWLSEQLDTLTTRLETSELRLHEFKRDKDILTASFEDRQSISSQRMLTLNDTLTRVRMRRAELEAKRHTVEDARRRVAAGETEAYFSIPGVAASAAVTGFRGELTRLEQERASLSTRYLDKHPRMAEIDARIAPIREAVQREVDKALRLAEIDVRETADTEHQLEALIAGAKREAFELNRHTVDYNRLKREQENNQRLYDLVLQRKKETDLSSRMSVNNAQLLDRALLPRTPVKPNRTLIVFVAFILGLVGGIALAFAFEQFDNTIKGHEDVEQMLQLPFLGIVPAIRESAEELAAPPAERARNRDLLTHRRPKSSVAECIRAVRTNLLFMTPEKQLRRLLVTSSSPQEGKTTVAANLAIAMAQSGSRTLLIDTDMRRPRTHRAFALTNDAGLTSVLVGQAKVDDVIRETLVPNLFLLTCGPIPPNPAELLHTAKFRNLVQELEGKFDRLIFDSPPVAAVSDALVLSDVVDGCVLVVKAGHTVREVAMRTKQSLVDVKANILGVVVNDLDLERRGYGYYYYYQRYGYYYGEKTAES